MAFFETATFCNLAIRFVSGHTFTDVSLYLG